MSIYNAQYLKKSRCAAVCLKRECFQLSSEFCAVNSLPHRLAGKLIEIRRPAAAKHLSPQRIRVTEHFLLEEDLRERAELSEAR